MKKLVFMFAAFAAVSFASCGGNATPAAEVADSATVDTTVVDSAACDSAACDSVAADSVAA